MCRYCKPLLLLFFLLPAVASAAADLDALRGLITAGKYDQAMQIAEAEIKTGNRDTALRFYYAYAAAQLGQTDKAIDEFRRLANELPKAPEPRNNLATLYAQQGKFDEARRELEAALATHQSYSTAHRNLGEIYSAMAAEAYNRALARGEQRTPPAPRLSLLNSMEMPAATQIAEARPLQPAPAKSAVAAAEPKPATAPVAVAAVKAPPVAAAAPKPVPAPLAVAAPTPAVAASKPEPPKPIPVAEKPAVEQVAAAKVATATAPPPAPQAPATPPSPPPPAPVAQPESKAETKPEAEPQEVALVAPASTAAPRKAGLDQQARAVTDAVQAWARAWAAQNPNAYLGAYAADFQPEGGVSKADWSKLRRERLTKPKRVEVKLVDMQVKLLDDNTAQARFLQHYSSDIMEDTVEKKLELVQEAGEWKIQREHIGQRQY